MGEVSRVREVPEGVSPVPRMIPLRVILAGPPSGSVLCMGMVLVILFVLLVSLVLSGLVEHFATGDKGLYAEREVPCH